MLTIAFLMTVIIGTLPSDRERGRAAADDKADKASPAPSFQTDIQPLFKAKCWRCHGETVRKAELTLHTTDGILKGSESGAIIVAGKSAESRLFEVLHEGEMPPDKKDPLTPEQIELVRKWIDAGASFGTDPAAAKSGLTQHDVLPILLLRCTACHGRQKQEAGLDLRTRAGILKGGKSGPAMVLGQPDQSLMLKRIHAEEMPPRARLTEVSVKPMEAVEIEKLTGWIARGAPEIADEPDVAGTPADTLVSDEDRKFWAYQKPQPVTVPTVKDAARVHNPIDAFVLQKLEAKGLTLATEADRMTLIRRATFDLTGLPPEPAEVAAFVADQSPRAYENVLDRLLASARYGERWGRHWLDVAGYSDCEGRREQHLPRPYAYRYRDYVVRAFNNDKPYDRFLMEQLAGDELADCEHATEITPEMADNVIATAFLRMPPDPTWANLTGFVPDRLEVMSDVIDIVGSGIMGMTFKCARCHTHKFDPIPQRDYYRLVALFKGALDEHDWLKPDQGSLGGLNSSFGARTLPYVSTAERQAWLQHNAQVQQAIDALKAMPKTPEIEAQIKAQEARRTPEPKIMALWDRGEPSPTYIYRRGDYQNSGTLVHAGVPAVLSDPQKPFEIQPPWPNAKSTGRRLAFAKWLTQPDHPLTARVMINRIWKHHFGQGIVRSVGNFGKTGDAPSHPELLDWLAQEFVRQGWSIKAMHRTLMTSNAYRQSSLVTPRSLELDPDNRLLSRMPLRRMEAEALRDSLLLISGQLIEQVGGPAEPVQVQGGGLVVAGRRRSIYSQQLRKELVSLLESFDLPVMNPNCLSRAESLVAPQALHLLNDTGVRQLAAQLAARVRSDVGNEPGQQIDRAYWITLSRPPSAEELAESRQILEQLTAQWTKQLVGAGQANDASQRALATYCHTLMNSAAFLYTD
ncbi:MAG: putative rane protein [Planctomycetaceae bacterium]|nr:putative rane protein [Planctomycetaceae bacterium]